MVDAAQDFSGRDFTAEFERLLELLRSEAPELTDLNHSDFGVTLLRLVARETDQLNAYIDRVFSEGFISTARFRQSLIELGKLVDYLPSLASPATTRLKLSRKDGVTGEITIPQGTAFGRSDGLEYLTTDTVTIPDTETDVEVNAIQGEEVTEEFEQADFQVVDWTGRHRVGLGAGVAAGSVEARHGDPASHWTAVDSFWRSTPDDLHFRVELDGDTDEAYLVLGDGTRGQGPPPDTLHVRFLQTAGAAGNCGAGIITVVPDDLDESITCTNIEAATGGAGSETVSRLRRGIPAVTHAQRRAVTTRDYEALVEKIPGVLHCRALDRNDDPRWPHMYVSLFLVPEGGGPVSSYLKDRIWAELADKGHLGSWRERYLLFDAVEHPVDVAARIGVSRGYDPATVRAAVMDAIDAFFAPENMEIGGIVKLADLHAAVSAAAGVSWADLDAPLTDIRPAGDEIPVAGTVTVTTA